MTDKAQQAKAVADLRERLIQHVYFLKGKRGKQLDLRDQSFERLIVENVPFDRSIITNCRFSLSNLSGSTFRHAQLSNTEFSHCDLTACDFSDAQMKGVKVSYSDVEHAALKNLDAREVSVMTYAEGQDGARPGTIGRAVTDFSNSDFQNTDLTGSILRGALLREVNLKDSILKNADLRSADLSGSCLMGADFTGANLADSQLKDVVFSLDETTRGVFGEHKAFQRFERQLHSVGTMLDSHEEWSRSQGVRGLQASFKGREIFGLDLSGRDLAAIDFSDCVIRGADFTGTILAAANFRGAKVSYSKFDKVNARGIYLGNAAFTFCSFIGTDFSDLHIADQGQKLQSNVRETRFTRCNLEMAVLTPEQLAQTRLVNTRRPN